MQNNFNEIKKDFPVLNNSGKKPLVYLDSAATAQKPVAVIHAIKDYYERLNANPHRGAYELSILATEAHDAAREAVRDFIGASSTEEIIFTKGSTESFNLLAYSYGMTFVEPGDEIVLSIAEHHSNLIPWQQVAKAKGAILKYMYLDSKGELTSQEINSKITSKTKLVAITMMSNALGTVFPVDKVIERAHEIGAVVCIDAAQGIAHRPIDVKSLDADFLVFSGHKIMAPMGIGVLFGKKELLNKMPPFLFGGDMVEYVYEDKTTFAELPYKFEGGTQNVEAAIGLMEAIKYIKAIGVEKIEEHVQDLLAYCHERLEELDFITIYGSKDLSKKGGVISFNVKDVHPHDVSTILDSYGIAIRSGNHCAQPLMRFLGINSTCRVSFYLYNTRADVDAFIDSLKNVRRWLGYGS